MAKGKVEVSSRDTGALLIFETVNRWLRDLRPMTRTHSLRSMVKFTRIAGMNPDQFLKWAKTRDSVDVQDLIDKAAEGLTPALGTLLKADIRGFLRRNGYNNLPKTRVKYSPKDWHRGYRKEEVRKLLSYLDNLHHKLFAYIAVETGLRAQMILDIRYRHIKEDFEANIIPAAVRFEPEYFARTKAAGFTFLGPRSIATLKEYLGTRRLKDDEPLVPLKYIGIYDALSRAKRKAGLDPKIQVLHGFRKYFEKSLDDANIDHEKKMVLEGHFAGTRARSYTDREWEELRPLYRKAYLHIDPEAGSPEIEKRLQSWEEEKTSLLQRIAVLEKLVQAPQIKQTIPDEDYDELARQAGKRGITLQEMVHHLIGEWMAEYEKRRKEKKKD